MVLGKVVGRVSSVQKLPTLKGLPLVIVQRLSSEGKIRGDDMTIAIDPLGVGMGQTVLMITGGAAGRVLLGFGVDTAADAAIVAIVDNYDIRTP